MLNFRQTSLMIFSSIINIDNTIFVKSMIVFNIEGMSCKLCRFVAHFYKPQMNLWQFVLIQLYGLTSQQQKTICQTLVTSLLKVDKYGAFNG